MYRIWLFVRPYNRLSFFLICHFCSLRKHRCECCLFAHLSDSSGQKRILGAGEQRSVLRISRRALPFEEAFFRTAVILFRSVFLDVICFALFFTDADCSANHKRKIRTYNCLIFLVEQHKRASNSWRFSRNYGKNCVNDFSS